jgi:hypothetical protein
MSEDLERDLKMQSLDGHWRRFVEQVHRVKTLPNHETFLLEGGVTNRCSLPELFFTFVLFVSVIYLGFLIRRLWGGNLKTSEVESFIVQKILRDVAILFAPTSEKAIRR